MRTFLLIEMVTTLGDTFSTIGAKLFSCVRAIGAASTVISGSLFSASASAENANVANRVSRSEWVRGRSFMVSVAV